MAGPVLPLVVLRSEADVEVLDVVGSVVSVVSIVVVRARAVRVCYNSCRGTNN